VISKIGKLKSGIYVKLRNNYFIIFLTAVLIRIIASLWFYSIFQEWAVGSSKTYRIGLAESILSGKGFSYNGIPNLYQSPVYPLFLAIVFFILGKHMFSVVLCQSILDGVSSIFVSKIGSKFSENGSFAGVIYAIYPYAITQSLAIVDTTLFVLLCILSIYYFLNFFDNQRISNIILASFLTGVGILNRPSLIVVIPSFLVCMVILKYDWRLILRYFIISIFLSSLVPFLWAIRNYSLTNQFPILSVGGSHFMWYGHNEHISEVLKKNESPDIIGYDPRYSMNPNITVNDFFGSNPTRQAEFGNYCLKRALSFIKNNKYEVLKYSFSKLKLFLSWEYFPANVNQPYQKLRLLVYKLMNAPITILGWFGLMILLLKKNKSSYFLTIFIVGFILIHMISLPGSRHKIPLDALFISLIPLSISYIYSKIKKIRISIVKT
jgi:hypothetical protein